MSEILKDQAARDLAGNDLAKTILVEAAAGTGKTTILINRILSIVREKHTPLTRVVAITFTEKAAGELKIKLRKELEKQIHAETGHKEFYRKALLELDLMPIGTIHSFCSDLIRQRPVEAGIDPLSQTADQQTTLLLREEVWSQWISQQLSRECQPVLPLLESGGRLEVLRSLFNMLIENRDELERIHVPALSDSELLVRLQLFVSQIESGVNLLSQCSNLDDLCAAKLLLIQIWLKRKPTGDNPDEYFAWLSNPAQWKGGGGQKGNWNSEEFLKAAKDFCGAYAGYVQEMLNEYTSRWAKPLIEWLKDSASEYAIAKESRRLLDFSDLLILARDMLRESIEARGFFKQRFDFVLVDEFQDTDPLQTEIIFYLCENQESHAQSWDAVDLIPGKLFIVGDPKQSIYRFRRADLDLYGKVKNVFSEIGAVVNISVNFRSAPQIIEEVNGIFKACMKGEVEGRYEPEYVAMEPFQPRLENFPRTVFLPPPPGLFTEKVPVADSAKTEAGGIAEYIQRLASSGHQIEEKGERVPLSYRHIAVLFRQYTHSDALEEALRARDIPYQSEGGRAFASRVEFQALRTVLGALDNPYDSVRVVGALRSPFFACSDEELVSHKLSGGGFNYLKHTTNIDSYLAGCFSLLEELYNGKNALLPSETLTELFEKTEGLQILALKPLGENRVANLLKVLDMSRALERSQNFSFHDLVRWLTQLESISTGEGDSPVIESGDDFVQLLTFHKAKGLEFPVVILYSLAQKEKSTTAPLLDRSTAAVEFHAAPNTDTAAYRQAQEREQDRDRHEDMRLFYVACTRAKDQLVIPAYWSETASGFLKLLGERYPRDTNGAPSLNGNFVNENISDYNLLREPPELLRVEITENANGASSTEFEQWKAKRTLAAKSLIHSQNFAVASQTETPERPSSKSFATDSRTAKVFGMFVHRILETLALPGGEDLDQAAALAAHEIPLITPPQVTEAKSLVRRALQSELFRERIAKAQNIYRELPYAALLDGVLYEGKMDLVFMEEGRPVIVDFKTDRVNKSDAELRARKHHAAQAKIYAKALQSALHVPVREVIIYFLRSESAVSV